MIKKILLSLALFAVLSADEVDRIEKIVKDISELRKSYDICENELYVLKQTKGDGAQKSQIYEREIDAQTELFDRETQKLKDKNSALKAKIIQLEKKELALQDIIDEQAEEVLGLSKRLKQNTKQECAPCIQKPSKKVDDNPFPTLMMKEGTAVSPVVKKSEKVESKKIERKKEPLKLKKQMLIKEETFTPSAFRLNTKSDIYDEYEGNVIDHWDEETSFTSNIRKGEWIKITGYFVEGKWKSAASKTMWIEMKQVMKR